MYRVFEHSQVVLSGFQCMYVIHEAHQNEICQTNFDTAVLLSRSFITFCELAMHFSFAKIKKQNMTIMFLLIFHFSTKTTQPIEKLFLPIELPTIK